MASIMLIGETGSGKSNLIRALSDGRIIPRKLMAVDYCGPFINTPGEFLENRRFYPALITSAAECDIVLMLQDATRGSSLFPPHFAIMFNRTVQGVVTNADADTANAERAERFLRNAGVREILRVGFKTGMGLEALRVKLAETVELP